MKNRIARSTVPVLLILGLATMTLLSRPHLLGEAMAQSQPRPQKWEYCYVSNPFQYGSASGTISFKVFVSQGGDRTLADSDSSGIAALNKLGAEGWELVTASDELNVSGGDPVPPAVTRFLLKRPKQ